MSELTSIFGELLGLPSLSNRGDLRSGDPLGASESDLDRVFRGVAITPVSEVGSADGDVRRGAKVGISVWDCCKK